MSAKRTASRAFAAPAGDPPTPVLSRRRESISKQVTQVLPVTAKLDWKIGQFGKLMKLYKNGQNLISQQFSAHANDNVNWELHVYPNGKREEDANHVSFFLRQVGLTRNEDPVMTEFQIYCMDTNNQRVSVCRDTKDFQHQQGRGKFQINKDRMEASFRPDASIELHCEVEYFSPGSKHTVQSQEPKKKLEITPVDIDFKKLLDNEILTDCCIKVGSKLLKAHRSVLALQSEVFKSMFSQDGMIEAQNGIIDITDSYYEPVRAMLEFMYTGYTDAINDCAEDILTVADKYDIHALKDHCERRLANTISLRNLCDLLLISDTYNAGLLKEKCVEHMAENHQEVINMAEWKRLKKDHSQFATEILEKVLWKRDQPEGSPGPSSSSSVSTPVKMESPSTSDGRPPAKRVRKQYKKQI